MFFRGNPDSLVLEDPVRKFLVEEFRANNNRNDDRLTLKEFMTTISTLELGFNEEDLQALFREADADNTGNRISTNYTSVFCLTLYV